MGDGTRSDERASEGEDLDQLPNWAGPPSELLRLALWASPTSTRPSRTLTMESPSDVGFHLGGWTPPSGPLRFLPRERAPNVSGLCGIRETRMRAPSGSCLGRHC